MQPTTKAGRAARSTGRRWGVDIMHDHLPTCNMDECENPFYCKGLYVAHYMKTKKRSKLDPESVRRGDGNGNARKHWNQGRAVQEQKAAH
jgi:hypothetical protein